MEMMLVLMLLSAAAVKASPHVHSAQIEAAGPVAPHVGSAAGPVAPKIETVYANGYEYIYWYESQVVTGLPLGSRIYSGLKIKGQIRLQKISLLEMKMEVREARIFKVVGAIEHYNPTKEMIPDEALVELLDADSDSMKSMLAKPVKFSYMLGHVEDLISEVDDPDWSVNIKKGALSLFEISFNSRHSLSPGVDVQSSDGKAKLYRVVEASVSGECETSYKLRKAISSEQIPSMEILKVRDLNKCIDKVVTTRSVANGQPCEKMSEIFSAQSSVRYSLLGKPDQFIILSAVGESQYNLVPHTEKQGRLSTLANQTLILIDYRPITDQIPEPMSIREHAFPLTVQARQQGPSMASEQASAQSSAQTFIVVLPVAERQEKVEMVKKVLAGIDILMKKRVEEEVTVLIRDLHRLLSELDKAGLETIVADVTSPRARKVLLDTMPTVGKHAAMDVLLARHESAPGTPWTTAISLMTLGLLPEPDIAMVRRMMEYVPKVDQQDIMVKRAAWLCLGNLGNKLAKRKTSEIAGLEKQQQVLKMLLAESNDIQLRKKLHERLEQVKDALAQTEKLHSAANAEIIKMVERLYSSEDADSKLLALKTIRNLAYADFMPILKSVVQHRDSPLVHRVVAILSMKKLAVYDPEMVRSILLPLYFDRSEEEEVRSLALLITMMIQLPKPEEEMVAKSLSDEPSAHIRALVASVLTMLSNQTSPCSHLKTLTYNSTLALRFSKEPQSGINRSNMKHTAFFDNDLQMGQIYEQVMLYSSKEKLPRVMAVMITSISEGHFVEVLEAGYIAKGLDGVLDQIMEDPSVGGVSQLVRKYLHPRNRRSASDPAQEIKDIKAKLGVKPRKSEPLEGVIHFSLYGYELMYVDIATMLPQKSIQEAARPVSLLQKLEAQVSPMLSDIRGILGALKGLMNQQRSIMLPLARSSLPTETGLPLKLDSSMIGAIKVDGDIQIRVDPHVSSAKSLLSNIDSIVKLRISAVAETVTDMMAELKNIHSGVSVMAKVSMDVPTTLSINVDPSKDKMLVKITDQKAFEPIKIEMKPVAVIKRLPEKAAHYPSPAEEKEIAVMDGAEVKMIYNAIGEVYMGRELSMVGMRTVRKDNGRALPSISGKQVLHVKYDPKSYTDLDIQFQHVRVKPDTAEEEQASPPKSSWWRFDWLLAPSDTAPPKYEAAAADPAVQSPQAMPAQGFINLEKVDLSLQYLKDKFSDDAEILESGVKSGLVIRVVDPDASPKHEIQLSTFIQRDESSQKYLYAIEIRRRPVLDETKDWKMVTSMKVDLPVSEMEPSDLADNEYQHDLEQLIQAVAQGASSSIAQGASSSIAQGASSSFAQGASNSISQGASSFMDLKSRILLQALTSLDEQEQDAGGLLERLISHILAKEVDASLEGLKLLVQKQRGVAAELGNLWMQEMTVVNKQHVMGSLKGKIETLHSIASEVSAKLGAVVYGQQQPEEAVLVLYIMSSQKEAAQRLQAIQDKIHPLLSFGEMINVGNVLGALVKEHALIRLKQERHSLDKQQTEKDRAVIEMDPADKTVLRDLMSLEKSLISIKIDQRVDQADPIAVKKTILELNTKLGSVETNLETSVAELDKKMGQKVAICKMLRLKIVEILLHQHLVSLELSDSKLIKTVKQSPALLTGPKSIDIEIALRKQTVIMMINSKRILKRMFIVVDAIRDLNSLVSLTTPAEQKHLKSLQQLKLRQLLVSEHLQEISHPEHAAPATLQVLEAAVKHIQDVSQDVQDTIASIVADGKKPVLSIVVIRALEVLAGQLPVAEHALQIVKGQSLVDVTSGIDAALRIKQEIEQLKVAVVKAMVKIAYVQLGAAYQPGHAHTASVSDLLKMSIQLEAQRLQLKPAVAAAVAALDQMSVRELPVAPSAQQAKMLYAAISQAADVQHATEVLSAWIQAKLAQSPRDASLADLLERVAGKQAEHVALVKHLEDKLQQQAGHKNMLSQPLMAVQKLKDAALRHGRQLAEMQAASQSVAQPAAAASSLPARSLQPQQSIDTPMKAQMLVTYGLVGGKQSRVEILLLGSKSMEQLLWEKDQSLPDRQDAMVSHYLQDKLGRDDRAALGYQAIKDELNTYRHLHVDCAYEDSLPVSVRWLAWQVQELIKLTYANKVTLMMPDGTNIANKLHIIVQIKKDNRMLDMEIKTPQETNVYKYLAIPSMCKLAAKPISRPVGEQIICAMTGASSEATCEVSADRIQTLSGIRYALDMEGVEPCERVLAVDCGQSDKLLITSKPVKTLPGKQVLKIITPEHKIEVIPQKAGVEVQVDEASRDLVTPVIVKGKLSIHKWQDGSIEVRLPQVGVSVVTNGIASSIKVNKIVGPKLCGLCGELQGSVAGGLLDPHQAPIYVPSAFISTYLVPDAVCPAKAIQKANDVPAIRKAAKFTAPIEITQVLQLAKERKTCFSRAPVKVCPGNSQPEGARSVLVSFHCLRSSHSMVPVYMAMAAKQQIISELQLKRISVNEYVSEPSACVAE